MTKIHSSVSRWRSMNATSLRAMNAAADNMSGGREPSAEASPGQRERGGSRQSNAYRGDKQCRRGRISVEQFLQADDGQPVRGPSADRRSEERRVGKEWGSP